MSFLRRCSRSSAPPAAGCSSSGGLASKNGGNCLRLRRRPLVGRWPRCPQRSARQSWGRMATALPTGYATGATAKQGGHHTSPLPLNECQGAMTCPPPPTPPPSPTHHPPPIPFPPPIPPPPPTPPPFPTSAPSPDPPSSPEPPLSESPSPGSCPACPLSAVSLKNFQERVVRAERLLALERAAAVKLREELAAALATPPAPMPDVNVLAVGQGEPDGSRMVTEYLRKLRAGNF
ncbi:hypothetical protein I4F81_010325 [Pyropia yezoensis]|uniref:Uncharacterized protein n=1 Tax=Pyropia yezoensis TaxID=2788 RepID=A0ACC3CCB7_PYRYE|nr:hypothetical protein I4F81_010325 [Neopyropia yezoensis]